MRLATLGRRLIAVFGDGRRVVVVRLVDRRWRRLGKPIPTHGAVVAFSENAEAAGVADVALVDVARNRRVVWSFQNGRWVRSAPLEGVGAGPMPSGPVRLAGRLYLPVVDATTSPWLLSVYVLDGSRWRRLGRPLNRGDGSAQGVLRVNDGAVWAAWQENAPRDDGRFDTEIYTKRIASSPRSAELVWSGVTIGPGDVETVTGAGRRWLLYSPAAPGGRNALTARVEPYD